MLLEVCDERVDGIIDRMKGVENDDVVVPGAVHIVGMPAGVLPGGVDEVVLLSRLRTKVGKGVSLEDLKSDAELLLRTGLFESVIVRGRAEDEHGARTVVWKEGKVTLVVSVAEIVFTVHPMGAELTSDIRFKWNVYENFVSATSDAAAEVEVMRRAGRACESERLCERSRRDERVADCSFVRIFGYCGPREATKWLHRSAGCERWGMYNARRGSRCGFIDG